MSANKDFVLGMAKHQHPSFSLFGPILGFIIHGLKGLPFSKEDLRPEQERGAVSQSLAARLGSDQISGQGSQAQGVSGREESFQACLCGL